MQTAEVTAIMIPANTCISARVMVLMVTTLGELTTIMSASKAFTLMFSIIVPLSTHYFVVCFLSKIRTYNNCKS